MTPIQIGMLVLKLVVTGALLWGLFSNIDIGPVADRLASMQLGWIVVAVAVLFGQLLLTGIRWYFVSQLVNANIKVDLAIRLILVGQFFNQVLPSSVGGDGVRAWLLSREGISIRRALVSVICDRGSALVLLVTLVACTLPIVILSGEATVPSAWSISIAVAVLTVAGLLFLFFWGEMFSQWLIDLPRVRPVGVLIRDMRIVLFSSVISLWIIGLTIVVQIMVVLSVCYCALALGVEFKLVHLLILPLIMLLSSIPISFAGWGLRESVMVVGLGFAGVAATDALAISVSFGIAQIFIGLPGVVVVVMSNYYGKSSVFDK